MSNILSRLFGQQGLMAITPANFMASAQPPVQGPPQPSALANAGKVTNTLFQNPAFLTALNRFGQNLQQGQSFGQSFGQFGPDVIAQQQLMDAQKASSAQQQLANLLTMAQIQKTSAEAGMVGKPELTATQKELLSVGIDPNSAEGRRIIIEKLTKPQTEVNIGAESTRGRLSEERRGKLIEGAFASADASRNIAGNLSVIEDNLNSLVASGGQTGPAAGLLTFMNDAAQQLLPNANINLNEASSLTAIEGASNALAVPLTKELGVNPTDNDYKVVRSTVARAGTSLPANYAFVDVAKQAADRNVAIENIIVSAEEQGLSEIDIRKRIASYKQSNPIVAPVPLPKSKAALQVGKKYTTDKGVLVFDGTNLVRQK